jgi:hypothetical protein
MKSRQLIASHFGPPIYIGLATNFQGALREEKPSTALQLFRLAMWCNIRRRFALTQRSAIGRTIIFAGAQRDIVY